MKISVLDWNTMTMNGDLSPEIFSEYGETVIHERTSAEDTVKNIGDAEAVLCNKVVITKDIIDKCQNLRYIGLFATGYNNIDTVYAADKGITVCNAGQYSTNAVAQHVFAFILDYFSRISLYDKAVKNGEWDTSPIFSYFPYSTGELYGKTIAVIGFGSIGRTVAEIAEAFGMKVIVSTRTIPKDCPYELADIKTAASRADILTLHCPLTDATKGLINSDLLSVMKKSAILINTSRGGTVVEADLAQALNNEKIAAAYLDVLECEPMRGDTPLKNAKNCVITPHIAWAPLETRQRLLNIAAENLKAWQNGCPQNKVN
ncbi:MAG: D-2-hydroxyacid dehydrogenase [Ruminococcus sp.]|nr:D-2-hydroxyacid dehydrogenase [Ruminococcus sp.]